MQLYDGSHDRSIELRLAEHDDRIAREEAGVKACLNRKDLVDANH